MTDAPAIAEQPIGQLGGPSQPSFAPSIVESNVMTALGDFLTATLQIQVVQGQDNRVPQPKASDYAVITARARRQLATTTHEEVRTETGANEAVLIQRSTQADVQIDIYGPKSTDGAQIVTTLFRDEWGCRFFVDYGMQPLYCDDGRQMPLINGEFQYEARWMILASLQINPTVSTPTQFGDTVAVNIFEVA